jgi:hypothetical protein
MADDRKEAFHARVVELCERADRECSGLQLDCLREKVRETGGFPAAVELVGADNAPGGFVRLWEHGRLDLSLEAEILRSEWDGLFEDALRERARERLERYGYAEAQPTS